MLIKVGKYWLNPALLEAVYPTGFDQEDEKNWRVVTQSGHVYQVTGEEARPLLPGIPNARPINPRSQRRTVTLGELSVIGDSSR